jgi:hypothetical protein
MRAQEAPQPGGCRMPKEAQKIKRQYRAASRAAGPTHPHFAWSRVNRHEVEVWRITPGEKLPFGKMMDGKMIFRISIILPHQEGC